MKIGNFNLSKKTIIIGGVVFLILILLIVSNNVKKQNAIKKAQEQAQEQAKEQTQTNNSASVDADAQLQASLVEKYGNPPKGFEWDVTGNLVAKGTDDKSSAEEVLYRYLRALSILDFSTAEKYSKDSTVIADYKNFYDDSTKKVDDYYSDFLRKQFKSSLASMQIMSVSDTAVFANGTQNITVKLKLLDLSNRDFWYADKDKLFNDMYTYDRTESSDTKKMQYLYNYITDSYGTADNNWGKVGLKEYQVELVLTKGNGKGWLVSNDGELAPLLQYEKGFDVASYINSQYSEWATNKDISKSTENIDDGDDEGDL